MLGIPIIIVGGSAYADIDVLACASAYKQYFELQEKKTHAVITGPLMSYSPSPNYLKTGKKSIMLKLKKSF